MFAIFLCSRIVTFPKLLANLCQSVYSHSRTVTVWRHVTSHNHLGWLTFEGVIPAGLPQTLRHWFFLVARQLLYFYSSVTEPLAILQQFSYQVILINGFISHGKTNRIKFTRVKTEPREATFFFFNKAFIVTLLLLNCFYLACISFATHRNKLH